MKAAFTTPEFRDPESDSRDSSLAGGGGELVALAVSGVGWITSICRRVGRGVVSLLRSTQTHERGRVDDGIILALAANSWRGSLDQDGNWNRRGIQPASTGGKMLAILRIWPIGRKWRSSRARSGMEWSFMTRSSSRLAIAHDTGVTLCNRLEDGLAEADFVTAHSPLTLRDTTPL